MKKILVLNYEFPPIGGGASPVSYDLAKGMSENGKFDIDVVTMHFKGTPKYEIVNKNFRIHRVACWRRKKGVCHPWEQMTYLISGVLKCRKLIRENNYDLCHCHFIIPVGVLALYLKKKFGLKYIITPHGSDLLNYNPRFKFLYPFLSGIWKKIVDYSLKIISPSVFLKDEILKIYPSFNPNKILVIPNGIDCDKFIPQEKRKYIFSSGRLQPTKGFQYLIQAVSQKDIGYDVHIAGDGPMMDKLVKMANKSKTKIIFHGWLNNTSTIYHDLLEGASIFVLASEKENASRSLLEAMSAGCAIITTNSTGCAETINSSGLLFKSGDVEDLKSKLDTLINDSNYMKTIQKKARERVKTVFDRLIIIEKYTEIFYE